MLRFNASHDKILTFQKLVTGVKGSVVWGGVPAVKWRHVIDVLLALWIILRILLPAPSLRLITYQLLLNFKWNTWSKSGLLCAPGNIR